MSLTSSAKDSLGAAHEAVLNTLKGEQKAKERAASLYATVSQRIKAEGLLERTTGFYIKKVALVLSLVVAAWVAVAFFGASWWFVVPAAAVLGVLTTQLAFVGHEAAHRQVFASHKANSWAALLLANLGAGMSIGWWTGKHTRHHAAPNQLTKDPDIDMKTLSFAVSQTKERSRLGKALARHQGWFFFPLLLLAAFSFVFASYKALLDPKNKIKNRWLDISLLTGRLVGFVALALILLPTWQALTLVVVQMMVLGLYMGLTFAPNHKGMPVLPAGSKVDYFRRQVLTSRNIKGGRFMDNLMGGLNYQVEHHLFPSMPRPHLRRASQIVKAFCAEVSVPYCETKLRESYVIIAHYLNEVGLKASDPLECPMISQLRRIT